MYETKAFWGLESNPNAATLNMTFNTVNNLSSIIVIVVVIALVLLMLPVKAGFG